MQKLCTIHEDQMIAIFLQSELQSSRFGPQILEICRKNQIPRSYLSTPNTKNVRQNQIRRFLLETYRNYGQNTGFFDGFPKNIKWGRYQLEAKDFSRILYIEYDYWQKLSQGSRLPKDAAKTIQAGIEVFGVSNQNFQDAAKFLQQGNLLPETILVTTESKEKLVILEGHLRYTAYALAPKYIPENFTAIIGISKQMIHWSCF